MGGGTGRRRLVVRFLRVVHFFRAVRVLRTIRVLRAIVNERLATSLSAHAGIILVSGVGTKTAVTVRGRIASFAIWAVGDTLAAFHLGPLTTRRRNSTLLGTLDPSAERSEELANKVGWMLRYISDKSHVQEATYQSFLLFART